ncbi:MAG: LicD family protein [Clostridia bacterium]|nr:LicD family protein [Clostridia bacterium]
MQLSAQDREKLKEIQVNMLKNFIAVCEKLGLTYYALGGTVLGAIRHGGYIPWDDDIDVGLMRKDYEVFVKEGQKYLKDGYFLQTYDMDKFPINFAKIRDENTTFVESTTAHIKGVSNGAYIDIFPLDYYPEVKGKAYHKKKRKYETFMIAAAGYRNLSMKTRLRQMWGKVLITLNPSLNSVEKIIKKREELFASVTESTVIANNCGAWDEKEVMPISVFGKGVKVAFEDIQILVPENYDEYLTRLYGDYMTPPPVDKQVPHHAVTDFSAEESYKTRLGR